MLKLFKLIMIGLTNLFLRPERRVRRLNAKLKKLAESIRVEEPGTDFQFFPDEPGMVILDNFNKRALAYLRPDIDQLSTLIIMGKQVSVRDTELIIDKFVEARLSLNVAYILTDLGFDFQYREILLGLDTLELDKRPDFLA